MAESKVKYGKKKVQLSRLYPFGKEVEVEGQTEKVTELELSELTGHDDEALAKAGDDKMYGYLQISATAGITYEESLMLARKDSTLITDELEGF